MKTEMRYENNWRFPVEVVIAQFLKVESQKWNRDDAFHPCLLSLHLEGNIGKENDENRTMESNEACSSGDLTEVKAPTPSDKLERIKAETALEAKFTMVWFVYCQVDRNRYVVLEVDMKLERKRHPSTGLVRQHYVEYGSCTVVCSTRSDPD
jgi:hypothetical protein